MCLLKTVLTHIYDTRSGQGRTLMQSIISQHESVVSRGAVIKMKRKVFIFSDGRMEISTMKMLHCYKQIQ